MLRKENADSERGARIVEASQAHAELAKSRGTSVGEDVSALTHCASMFVYFSDEPSTLHEARLRVSNAQALNTKLLKVISEDQTHRRPKSGQAYNAFTAGRTMGKTALTHAREKLRQKRARQAGVVDQEVKLPEDYAETMREVDAASNPMDCIDETKVATDILKALVTCGGRMATTKPEELEGLSDEVKHKIHDLLDCVEAISRGTGIQPSNQTEGGE